MVLRFPAGTGRAALSRSRQRVKSLCFATEARRQLRIPCAPIAWVLGELTHGPGGEDAERWFSFERILYQVPRRLASLNPAIENSKQIHVLRDRFTCGPADTCATMVDSGRDV